MSLATPSYQARPLGRRAAGPAGVLDRLPVAVLIGTLLFALMTLGKAVAVWRTGVFTGPDDAMRAVEVRDFMNGQGWFDLVPRRLSPEHPFAMHWSRLADVPLAASIMAFRLITDAATAERLTRIIEPMLFYILTLVVLARLARDLCGPRAALAVALLAAGALDAIGDFLPGRIHHHAVQILLLVAMAKFACDGLDPGRPRRMALAGAVAALSLAINLQNMPFVAATAAIIAVLWTVEGEGLARGLGCFGLGLAGGALALFLAQVAPNHYRDGACDAFGAPHFLAAVTGGLCLTLLGRFSHRMAGRLVRCVALAAAGALCLGILHVAYPACLGDPYVGVDPFIRKGWMAEVGEAMPLFRFWQRDPVHTIPIVIALLSGLAMTSAAAAFARGRDRSRWMLLFGLETVAGLGTLWQVRVAASAEILATLGGAWLLCRLFAGPAPARRFVALSAVLMGAAMTPAGWTAAAALFPSRPPGQEGLSAKLDPVDVFRCFEPASYDGLARLPPGLVLSTIDPGAHIMAYTAHRVIAAPYHRDAYGLRLALDVFGAAPGDARRLVTESKADYVALCTASPEVHDVVRASPEGFAAAILGDHVPPWLEPVEAQGPFRLFRVLPPRPSKTAS